MRCCVVVVGLHFDSTMSLFTKMSSMLPFKKRTSNESVARISLDGEVQENQDCVEKNNETNESSAVVHEESSASSSLEHSVAGSALVIDASLSNLGSFATAFFISQRIESANAFLQRLGTALSLSLIKFAAEKEQETWGITRAKKCISSWKRDIRQRKETQKALPDGLHPAFEVFDSDVLAFFSVHAVVNPLDLWREPKIALALAWATYQRGTKHIDMKETTSDTHVSQWRDSVKRQLTAQELGSLGVTTTRRRKSSHTGQSLTKSTTSATKSRGKNKHQVCNELVAGDCFKTATVDAAATVSKGTDTDAPLEPDLILLGDFACSFFVSQGITTTKDFLSARQSKDLALDLVAFMLQHHQKTITPITARQRVDGWKGDIRQRYKTREEGLEGIHPTFEVFNPGIRSFLTSQSVITPEDLFTRPLKELGEAWRKRHNGKHPNGKLTSAKSFVSKWRESVKRQLPIGEVDGMIFTRKNATTSVVVQSSEAAALAASSPFESSPGMHQVGNESATMKRNGCETLALVNSKLSMKVKADAILAAVEPSAVVAEPTQVGAGVTVLYRRLSIAARRKMVKRTFPGEASKLEVSEADSGTRHGFESTRAVVSVASRAFKRSRKS